MPEKPKAPSQVTGQRFGFLDPPVTVARYGLSGPRQRCSSAVPPTLAAFRGRTGLPARAGASCQFARTSPDRACGDAAGHLLEQQRKHRDGNDFRGWCLPVFDRHGGHQHRQPSRRRARSCPPEPWSVAFEHEWGDFCFTPVLPRNTHPCRRSAAEEGKGVIADGCGAPAMRGNRHLEEGWEGVRPGPGLGEEADGHDSDDLRCDDGPDPGIA